MCPPIDAKSDMNTLCIFKLKDMFLDMDWRDVLFPNVRPKLENFSSFRAPSVNIAHPES